MAADIILTLQDVVAGYGRMTILNGLSAAIRLLARGGILTGDGVYTVRLRATQSIPDLHQ